MKHFPLLLSTIYCLYLGIGGIIFMHLEWHSRTTHTITDVDEWASFKEFLTSSTNNEYHNSSENLLGWILGRCPHLKNETVILNFTAENKDRVLYTIQEKCTNLSTEVTITSYIYPWGYIDALYFSMTVVTTIGFGHISPSTTFGRLACIIYAVIGIPLTMVLLTYTSDFFGEILFLLFQARLDQEKQSSKIFIALGTTFYICVGFLVFIFLPPILFMHIEHWTYFEGVYFAFITLTTIGFGDFVTGKTVEGSLLYVYQIAIIIWIMSGLGYWVMIANFISRAMRSKKLQTLARKATDIKKLMNQVGLSQAETSFLNQHSKNSLNFLMQLCAALVLPENVEYGIHFGGTNSGTGPGTPPALLGISSLFENSGFGELIKALSPQFSKLGNGNLQVLSNEESRNAKPNLERDLRTHSNAAKTKASTTEPHSPKIQAVNRAFTSTSDENLKNDHSDSLTPSSCDSYPQLNIDIRPGSRPPTRPPRKQVGGDKGHTFPDIQV